MEDEVKKDIQDTVSESPVYEDAIKTDAANKIIASNIVSDDKRLKEIAAKNVEDIYNASVGTYGGRASNMEAALQYAKDIDAFTESRQTHPTVENRDYGPADRRIRTTGYVTTEGLQDVKQYTYPIDSSEGTPVGGVQPGTTATGIYGSGTTGVSAPEASLNPMSNDQVKNFYWKDYVPRVYQTVDPFEVHSNYLPDFKIKSTTTDPKQLAWKVSVDSLGNNPADFFGHDRVGLTELTYKKPSPTWLQTIGGGVIDAITFPIRVPMATIGAATEYGLKAMDADPSLINEVRNYTTNALMPATPMGVDDGLWKRTINQLPTIGAQLASIYFMGLPAAAVNVLANTAMSTASLANDIYDMPLSTQEKVSRIATRAGTSAVLNTIGMATIYPTLLGRSSINLLTKKGITKASLKSFTANEAIGEGAVVTDIWLDYYLRDMDTTQNADAFNDAIGMASVVNTIATMVGNGLSYKQLNEIRQAGQKGMLDIHANIIKGLKDAEATIQKIYGVDAEGAKKIIQMLEDGYTNGEYSAELKAMLDAQMSKLQPESVNAFIKQFEGATPEQAKEVGHYLRTQFVKDVMPKIGEGFSDSERMGIVGLMKGIASIMTYAGVDPRSVASEMFSVKRAKPGEGSSYVPKERTVYVAQDVGSIGLEIGMLTDTAAKSNLTPQSRSLLHEIGHGLDHMLSRADSELNGKPENTEPGLFAEWMPKYFDAIKTAFGPKVSEKVEALATNDRVKASGTLSKKRGKLARKRGTDEDVQLADTPEATSEYFAYALSHLTREQLFDLLGLTGVPAEVMDALVAMSTSDIVIPEMQKQLNAYKQSLVNTMKQNKTLIDQVLKEYNGDTSELKAAVEKFVAGDTDALSLDNLQKLADIVESFIDGETAEVVGEVFENISIKTFSEQAREEINSGLEEASPEQNEIVEALNKRLRDGGEESVADAESSKTKSAPKVIDKDLQQTLDNMEPTKESGKDIFDLSEKDESSDETLHEVSRDPDAALLASLYAKLDGKRVDTTLAHKLEDKLDGKTLIESQDDVIDAISNAPKGSKLYTNFTLGKYTGSVMDVLHAVNPALEKMFPVGRVSSARNQISNEHMRGWEAKAKEIVGGDNEYRKWTIDSQLKRYKTTKNLIGGKTVEVELSKQQLMSAYELLKQSDAGSNARIVKSYPEIKSLIDKNLTSQDKAVADMTQQHLQGIFDRIRDTLSEEDNIDLGKIENYFPIYDVIKTDTGTRINSAKARSVTNGRYAGGIEAQPIFEVLQRYVEWAANVESGYTRTLRRMKDVFNYKSDGMYKEQKYADLDAQAENNAFNIRQALRERYGENMVEKINSEVSDLLDQHPVYTPTGAFASATNTLISNAISWNILSLPKNLLSNMFIGMTEPGAFASFLKGLMAPRATYEDMIRYRAIADRLEGVDIDDLFNTATRSQGVLGYVMNNTKLGSFLAGKGYEKPVTALMAYSSLFKKLGQKTFMQFGDALGLVYGLKPTVDKMRAQGFNDAQINAELTRKIQEFTSTADKATEPKAIRDIKRTGVGPLLAFKKDLAIKAAKIARDLVDAYRGDSVAKQAAARDIAAIILSIGVFSAISAGVWDLWSDDEDVRKDAETAVKREVLSTILGYNPMVSAMGEPVAEYALGFGGTSGYSSPILSFGNNYIKDLKKDRKFNIAIDTATLVAGMPGLPKAASESQGLVGAIFGDYVDERERDYYTSMALGRTENYASKRSGYDPKQVDKTDEND